MSEKEVYYEDLSLNMPNNTGFSLEQGGCFRPQINGARARKEASYLKSMISPHRKEKKEPVNTTGFT